MNFLSIQINNNKFLIPGGRELISEGDESVLLSQSDKNKKKHFTRLKCIKLEPGSQVIIISLQKWEARRLKRTKDISATSGMILDKSVIFDDDPADKPTYLYYSGPEDNTIRFLDFNNLEEAALWAAIQDPTFIVSDDDDTIF